MDWTIVGVVVTIVALVSGWFWWWKPGHSSAKEPKLGNVELEARAEVGSISSEVEIDDSVTGDAGNVKLGRGAKSQDITAKVTHRSSKIK